MDLTVYWTQFAEDKLFDIFSYFEQKAGVYTARKIVKEIVDTTINLSNHPKKGTIEVLLSDKPQEFRYLVHKNYIVIYWINEIENRIEISTVFDCRQNPVKILY